MGGRGGGVDIFDKEDAGDLFGGGHALCEEVAAVLLHGEEEAAFDGESSEMGGLFVDSEHGAEGFVDAQDLEDADASAITEEVAVYATFSTIKLEVFGRIGLFKDAKGEDEVAVVFDDFAAVRADPTDKALTDNASDGVGDEKGFDAHIAQTDKSSEGAVGVDGGDDKVAGERGFEGSGGGDGIASFANDDDIGVLAQKVSDGVCEAHASGFVDLDLCDAIDGVFDGVFDGDDVDFVFAAVKEGAVDSGGFSRACGSSHEDHALGLLEHPLDGLESGEVGDQAFEFDQDVVGIEEAQDELFAEVRRDRGEAKVDGFAFVAEAKSAILGLSAFRDIHAAEDLEPRDERAVIAHLKGFGSLFESAIHAIAHDKLGSSGFDMDITCHQVDGFAD